MSKRLIRPGVATALWLCMAFPSYGQTLKIATVLPEGSSWMREMRAGANEVRSRTDGRVKLKFYPGGIMGNDRTVMRKIRAGQLHGGAFTGGSLTHVYPETDLYSLPLTFRSYAEVDYVRARMDEAILEGLERGGFVALALSEGGFAYLLSTEPVRSSDDLRGRKVWVPEADLLSRIALEVAGVSPVPLPLADVYTGLQSGLIDTVAAPPMAAIAFQWHTKIKYLTDVPLMYLVGVLAIERRVFATLRPEDQSVLREVVGGTAKRLDQASRQGDQSAMEALLNEGIVAVSPSSREELDRWYEMAEAALVELRTREEYSEAMIDTLLGYLETYRGEPRAGLAE